MSRRGRTRRTTEQREQQLAQLLTSHPKTVVELAQEMECSDGLVRFYLKRLGSAVRRIPVERELQRPVLTFEWAAETGAR